MPGSETNTTYYTPYIIKLLQETSSIVTIGVLPTYLKDLWQEKEEEVTKYHELMKTFFNIFMTNCPKISVITLMQPAEFKPKTTTETLIDRLVGRIRPLIPA